MPSLTLGQESFTLRPGETRVGGTGGDALPFAPLRALPTVAVLLVTPSESVSLWPESDAAVMMTVNGVPLGSVPVPVTHGAKIEIAGLRLTFRDGRETGTTGPMAVVTRETSALNAAGEWSAPGLDGGRLFRVRTREEVSILDSGLVIGRDPDSDLVVSGAEVSRRHAVLRRSAAGYVLTDVSTNGTYVNGRRIEGGRALRVGDVIRIGEEELRFDAGRPTYDPSATPAAPPRRLRTERPITKRDATRLWRRLSTLWRR